MYHVTQSETAVKDSATALHPDNCYTNKHSQTTNYCYGTRKIN